jgi:hypothetical protein
VANVAPTVDLDPVSPDLRVLVRRWPGGGAVFLFNEGEKPYTGRVSIPLDGKLCEVDPTTGVLRAIENPPSLSTNEAEGEGVRKSEKATQAVVLNLVGAQSMMLVSAAQDAPADVAPPATPKVTQSLDLTDGWAARVDRQYVVGEHDFEIHPTGNPQFKPAALGHWANALGLGEDFSGHVTYRRTVSVPESMRGGRVRLDLGGLECAARVSIDGREVGRVLWSPWRIHLPPLEGRAEFVLEIQVANTLANEITSQRVRNDWSKRKDPGWPSPYNARQIQFEMDSRGGGLIGPVRLQRVAP